MSDRAQRVLDALMEYDAGDGIGYPIKSISYFFDDDRISSNGVKIEEDYEALTVDEEKQIIEAFLEHSY